MANKFVRHEVTHECTSSAYVDINHDGHPKFVNKVGPHTIVTDLPMELQTKYRVTVEHLSLKEQVPVHPSV